MPGHTDEIAPGKPGRAIVPAAEDPRARCEMIRMDDGVLLATDVYLPAATPAPTVLVRLPYDKSAPFAYMPMVARHLNDAGFSVCVQDVRGKVRSEGDVVPFVSEVDDGWSTLDWISRQSWSTGNVGMFGDSYYGLTQWAAVASGHPALKAIVPRVTSTEIGTDWMYQQGIFNLATVAEWAAHAWTERELWEFRLDWSVRPLCDALPAWLGGRRSDNFDAWRALGPTAAFWSQATFGGHQPSAEIRIPALHMGGWWDVFQRGQVRDFQRAIASSPAPQHLVMDATDHFDLQLTPDDEAFRDETMLDPGELEAGIGEYLEIPIRFLTFHLAGGDDPQLPPVRWKLAGAGWRESSAWPPLEARELRMFCGDAARSTLGPEGGSLSERPGHSATTVSWTHDPADLVPWLDRDPWRPLMGLPDERDVEVRDDVLTFTGPPVTTPLDLAGPVTVLATVCSSSASTHIMVKLVDVFPSGRARRILEGACLVPRADGSSPARIDLGSTGYRLPPGHRLRLEIASSAFPRYLPHPGTEADPWEARQTEPADQTLTVGGSTGVQLCLTVLPAQAAPKETAA